MQPDSSTVPASIRLRSTVSGANLSSLGIGGGVPKSHRPRAGAASDYASNPGPAEA
jgi:hypothetical protein